MCLAELHVLKLYFVIIYVEQILIFWSWVSVCVCGPFLPYCLVMHFGKLELVLDCCWAAERVLLSCSQKQFVTFCYWIAAGWTARNC